MPRRKKPETYNTNDSDYTPPKPKKRYIPPMSHPWKKLSFERFLCSQAHRSDKDFFHLCLSSAIVHRSSGNITAACLVFPAYAGVKLSQINSKLIQLPCLNSSKVPEYVFEERSGKSEFLKRMRGAGRALPGTSAI